MISLAEPNLNGNERKYLNECIDTTFVSSVGPFVSKFEGLVSEISGAPYCTAVSSGTAGLHMALKACGVEKDEMVCIPSFTFIATANAVSHCGAETWLIDIDEESWTMDPKLLDYELENKTMRIDGKTFHKESGKRIAAIMPVYTLGMPAHMDEIRYIGEKYGLAVIADAAAAIGAKYKGKDIGLLADATVFSFNGNKTATCGGGGAIISGRSEIVAKAKHLSTTARCGKEYIHDMIGYNYRMTNVQAAIGCAQLERVQEFLEKKKYIGRYYYEKMKDINNISFFPKVSWADSANWFSGIILGERYDIREICDKLINKGIEGRLFWKPVHLQVPYERAERSEMSVTEGIWNKILTLPSSTGITDEELQYVVNVLRDILIGNI